MTKASSLVVRVVLLLVAAQLPAFLIAWLVTQATMRAGDRFRDGSLDELAVVRTTRLVAESVASDAIGSLRVVPTPALRAEMDRTPRLMYAVFDPGSGEPIAGSFTALTDELKGLVQARPAHMHFARRTDAKDKYAGHLGLESTPAGLMQIAIYGQTFRWVDLYYSLAFDLSYLAAFVLAALLTSAWIAWFAVRTGLRPLNNVTRQAEHIDLNSLDQRFRTEEVPVEIMPLVVAFNAALTRLDAGAAKMRRLTANIAHELRTPLAIMRARLESSHEPTFTTDLKRDASKLQTMVEQMLVAARLTERQTSLDQEVDLVETVYSVTCDHLPLAVESGRDIEFESAIESVMVRGNRRAIECIVVNLIDNALRAEPRGGIVIVRIGADATVEIVDHGDGVGAEEKDLVFEPFWRKCEATPGTGLGLAISKELMEKHGGDIRVEDTRGGGATFKLSFPRST
jgi:signal transduction histidine kinase